MYIFESMTEEELNAFNLIEDGIYNFEVVKSTRKISRSNNPMCELNLNIWDKEGKQHLIFDYLVFSKVPLNIKKVKHFCEATGLSEDYKKGQLPEDLERRSGKVHIGVKDEQPKPEGGMYPKKNYVIDYVVEDKKESENKSSEPDFSDDIPF